MAKIGLFVYFDENVISVTAFGNTITSSGDTVTDIITDEKYTVNLKDGYIIDTVICSSGLDITNITDTTFYAGSTGGLLSAEITITSKLATSRKSVDLTTLPGWSSLSSGSHSITIVAKADGYRDSEPSAAVSVEKAAAMPTKGDLISIDGKQYRVLKTNDTVAEVLAMYDASTSQKFDTNSSYNNTYGRKNIDTYCNNTFYSGLSSAMKSAIVDKTFTQDSWELSYSVPTPSHYTGKYGSTTYYLTLTNAAFGTSITRHCYVLSVQDVLDYLDATTSMSMSDTTLTDTNLWKMVWNQTTSPGSTYPWLRSVNSNYSDYVFNVSGGTGYFSSHRVDRTNAVRPAFQIDLSKVEWTKQ